MIVKLNSEWFEGIEQLPVEVQREVCLAVIKYSITGTQPELKPMGAGVFFFIKKEIDKTKVISAQRSAAGKKSAEKRKNNSICSNKVSTSAQQIPTNSNKNSGDLNIDNNLTTSNLINNLSLKEKEEITKKEITKKETPKKKDARVVFVESLPQDWREVVEYWLRYKSERRENYKSKQSLEVFYNKLVRDSEQSVSRAKEMIDQSIANNWSGVYSVKERPRYSTSSSDSRAPLPKDYTGYYEPVGHEI